MHYSLLRSLEDAAAVRTASFFYNDSQVENIIRLERNALLRSEMLEKKIEEKAPSLLPASLRKRVATVIFFMYGDLQTWKKDHKFFLGHFREHLDSCLCWKTDGFMNRTETARKLVLVDRIDPKIRFILACTYFLEDEVIALWEKHEEIANNRAAFHHTNIATRFWMEWLTKKHTEHWSEMVDAYFRSRRWIPRDIPTRVSCFYHLLSRECKQSIHLFATANIHSDDFRMIVNKMGETERIEIFRTYAVLAVMLCLDSPFRSLFLYMAKQAFEYLSIRDFAFMVLCLLDKCKKTKEEDLELFEKFWQMSPTEFKKKVKGCITNYMDNVNNSQRLKEFVRKCLDSI